MPEDGAKQRKLAFESDADMPDAPSPQFEAWAKWRDGPSHQMVALPRDRRVWGSRNGHAYGTHGAWPVAGWCQQGRGLGSA